MDEKLSLLCLLAWDPRIASPGGSAFEYHSGRDCQHLDLKLRKIGAYCNT